MTFMNRKTDYLRIYEIIAGVILVITTILFLKTPNMLYTLMDSDISKIFWDFKSHINFAADLKRTYSTSMHACFPPLIYLFYHFLYLIIPKVDNIDMLYNFVYAIYLSVMFITFSYICSKMLEKESFAKRLTATVLFALSAPFVFGITEQGNIVLLPMMLLAVAALWRDSENKVKRELALIFIAVAAGIKVYPAIFGIIYLAEKRYKEAIRLIIYGILFFFVPFVFTGGIDGMITFFNNQSAVHQAWGQYSLVSIYSYANFFDLGNKVGIILSALFGFVALITVFFTKSMWQKYFMIAFIMVMCPLWSGQYTVCFFLIAFFAFLQSNQTLNNKFYNNIYIIMFSLIFSANILTKKVGAMKITGPVFIIFFVILLQNITQIKGKTKPVSKIE